MSNHAHAWLKRFLWLLPLGLLWFALINHLRVDWSFYPQYAYGWVVPFLCIYLLWSRSGAPHSAVLRPSYLPISASAFRHIRSPAFQLFIMIFLCFLWLPTRLLGEANPEWRVVSWAMAVEVVGVTLLLGRAALGPWSFSRMTFPVCYFLVAVPWPGRLEKAVIQALTQADIFLVVELLNGFGLPAMQHGNVIEISAGMVGIDEACSGIRSVQATFMISLFVGEIYRLTAFRRILLCLSGFLISVFFNIARAALLTCIASKEGTGAISKWHDPAGVSILVACFVGLWGVGALMRTPVVGCPTRAAVPGDSRLSPQVLGLGLSLWLLFVGFAVEFWYRGHDVPAGGSDRWSVHWPDSNSSFKISSMPAKTMDFLRLDEGFSCSWNEPDEGTVLVAMYLRWLPGRPWVQAAAGHTPDACQVANGWNLIRRSERQRLLVGSLTFDYHTYGFTERGNPVYVARLHWEDGAHLTAEAGKWKRVMAVWAGRRNPGVRVLEVALWGISDAAQAETALRHHLRSLIEVKE